MVSFVKTEESNLPQILEIYNYYVLNTTATFHISPISIDEMKKLLFFDNNRYESFVIYDGENICGYCILAQYKTREAFNDTAEATIYLKPDYSSKGIGSLAIAFLERLAKEKEFHTILSLITGENIQSIKLFEKMGYKKCGHLKEVGKKFERLLDLVYYQKVLL